MNKINTKKVWAKVSILGVFAALLSSCTKVSVNANNGAAPDVVLAITQASPDTDPLQIIVDNTQINALPVTYGQSTNYFSLTSGKGSITFVSTVTAAQLLTDTVNFMPNTSYSAFLVNSASKPALLLITDTLTKLAAGSAVIRFVDVSPDAPAVDLVIRGGATLATNKTFEGFSSFVPVTGGTAYTFEVHQAGTATVLATLGSTNIVAGYTYTVWFRGLAANKNANDALALSIVSNGKFRN